MKLDKQTISILKNFQTINANLLIKPGSELTVVSSMRNILAKATVKEEFDTEFGIYDLNNFLGVISMLNKPELKLEEKLANITEENVKGGFKYWAAAKETLSVHDKPINMPEADVDFQIKESELKKLKDAAAILGAPDLAIVGEKGGDVVLKVCDKKNNTSNTFDIVVGENATADYTFYCKVENMKMIEGDYDVKLSQKFISHFQNTKLPIQYWIALEPDSTISK